MASPFILLTLFSLLLPTLSQPASAPIDVTAILASGRHFTSILRLLNQTGILDQLSNQLNHNSNQGMTLFTPTDTAFQNLPAGTINSLSEARKTQLVLYHVLPKFYSMDDLVTVSNPVPTMAGGEYGSLGLNISGRANQVKVSAGVVKTRISNVLRMDFPFAVYAVDKVLFPEEWSVDIEFLPKEKPSPPDGEPAKEPSFREVTPAKAPSLLEGTPAKAPSLPEGMPAKAPSSPKGAPAKAPSSAVTMNGGGRRMDMGLGLGVVGGLVVFCIAFL